MRNKFHGRNNELVLQSCFLRCTLQEDKCLMQIMDISYALTIPDSYDAKTTEKQTPLLHHA